MKSTQITYTRRRTFVLLLICALFIGILPMGQTPISKATETLDSAEDTAPSDYGLNNPSTTSDDITTWDCVYFGNYWQNDTNSDGVADKNDEKEPIKWRVLSVDGDDAFLLADQNLDCQKYNDTWPGVTWEACTMRSWLNGYGVDANKCGENYSDNNFLDNAFAETEQTAIKNTTVINEANPRYGGGGENTVDKVYLLSISEAENQTYGFTSKTSRTKTREAKNTAYAKWQGAVTYAGNGFWWLRSPGVSTAYASYVNDDGCVDEGGNIISDDAYAVRPALHLNLSSTSIWSYAGTVTSDGGGTEIAPPSTPTPSPNSTQTPLVPETPNPSVTSTPNPTLVPTVTESPNPPATLTPVPTSSITSTPNTTLPLVTESPSVGQNQAIMPLAVVAQDIISDEEQEKDITLGKVTALKLKAKKKSIQASWKKVSSASGYQIWISTSKNFKKKTVKTTKKEKLTVKKLKSGKTYFVKVHAYTVKNGERVYGAWSKTVKKKVK